MRVAIHQPNFVPHFGFFYKMSMCDRFIILSKVQFEKNGYQNRYRYSTWGPDEWVTMPVISGLERICDKYYVGGQPLAYHNITFISWVKETLGIQAELVSDVATDSSGTKRILENLNHYGATCYITHPGAKDKYLDEQMLKAAGIDIEYSNPQNANMNILEMFEKYGIDGTRKQLWKPKRESKKTEKTERPGE